jgi:quercetin dioxygenase-like cupin family protein
MRVNVEGKSRGEDEGWAAGRKQDLAASVSYQAGSVVSRTIISNKAGNVTLFAFDKGTGLSEHVSPFNALLYLLEGEALVTVAGEANRMEEGEGIILPAGKRHSLDAVSRFKMLLAMIR